MSKTPAAFFINNFLTLYSMKHQLKYLTTRPKELYVKKYQDYLNSEQSPLLFNENFENVINIIQRYNNEHNCYILVLLNTIKPSIFPISCEEKSLSAFVCHDATTVKRSLHVPIGAHMNSRHVHTFRCSDNTYISKHFICDGQNDCSNDEDNCRCTLRGRTVHNSSYCHAECHPSNCTCSVLFAQKKTGGCHIYKEEHTASQINMLTRKELFICKSSFKIPYIMVNDTVPDCLGGDDEPFFLLNQTNTNLPLNCPREFMLKCVPDQVQCYDKNELCSYLVDTALNILLICRNGKHLENCEHYNCVRSFKCPYSYCVPYTYICDGKWDCLDGNDELNCKLRTCQGYFRCSLSSTCIPTNLLCDSFSDCPLKDDEHSCLCPFNCLCIAHAVSCSSLLLDTSVLNSFHDFIFVNITQTDSITNIQFPKVVILILQFDNIENFHRVFQFNMHSLKLLDVKFNKIKVLKTFAMKTRVSSIVSVYLAYNQISNVDNFAFEGFCSLKVLDLSHNTITALPTEGIGRTSNLVCLILSSNPLTNLKTEVIQKINADLIIGNSLWVCCIFSTTNFITICAKKEFSIHCKRLLKNFFFLILSWINGFFVILANIILLCRHRSKSGIRNMQFSFQQVDLNIMGLSNLLFGIYLVVLAIFDSEFDTIGYLEHAQTWVKHWVCFFLAIISTISVLMTCYIKMYMSLYRYISVKKSVVGLSPLPKLFIKISVICLLCCTLIIFLLPNIIDDIENYSIPNPLCFILGYGNTLPLRIATTFAACVYCACPLLSTICYRKLLLFAKYTSKGINRNSVILKRDRRVKNSIIMLSFYSLISYIPTGLIYFISLSINFSSTFQYAHILVLLPCTPILDPIMYNLANIKKTVKKLVTLILKQKYNTNKKSKKKSSL